MRIDESQRGGGRRGGRAERAGDDVPDATGDNWWLRIARWAMRLQGVYFIVTGLWPVVDMGSFEWITGPKIDDWLVRMVGLLAASIGLTLLVAARGRRPSGEGVLLSFTSALSFLVIDVIYVLAGTIGAVYLLDAVAEFAFMLLVTACWMIGALIAPPRPHPHGR